MQSTRPVIVAGTEADWSVHKLWDHPETLFMSMKRCNQTYRHRMQLHVCIYACW